MNVIVQLEFEHIYFKAAVQQFSQYATETVNRRRKKERKERKKERNILQEAF